MTAAPHGWKPTTIGELCTFASGNGFGPSDWSSSGMPIIRIQNLNGSTNFNYFSGEADPAWLVNPGDLLFAWAGVKGVSFGPTIWNGPRGLLNQHIYQVRPSAEVDLEFLYLQMLHITGLIEASAHGFKSNLVHVRKSDITDQKCYLPPLPEQKAIAGVMSLWARSIQQLGDLIAAKNRLKEGMVQQLLVGKRRFRKFANHVHEQVRLNNVLEKVTDSVTPVAGEMYREIGIRSHGKGIFHKEPVSGELLGNKRVYRVVAGCITLNIVFAWERSLAVTTERETGMIASHRFPMFRPDPKKTLAEYVLLHLLSHEGSEALGLASPGGAGRNRTLSQTVFLKTPISLPPLDEQRQIVAFVQAADREINLLKWQLAALKEQKKGLMQKLLTGQIRVGGRQ